MRHRIPFIFVHERNDIKSALHILDIMKGTVA